MFPHNLCDIGEKGTMLYMKQGKIEKVFGQYTRHWRKFLKNEDKISSNFFYKQFKVSLKLDL